MNQHFRKLLIAFGLMAASASAMAVEIRVTTLLDASPNNSSTSSFPIPLPGTSSATYDNATRGKCSLREAIMSVNGSRAATAAECLSSGTANGLYCPYYPTDDNDEEQAGECPAATRDGSDVIVIDSAARGTIQLQYILPIFNTSVTVKGLGPDQTVITGSPTALATYMNSNTGTAPTSISTLDLPIFQVSPNLNSGGSVKLQDLQVRGLRMHYFRTPAGISPTYSNTNSTSPNNCGGSGQPTCCGAPPASNATAGAPSYAACTAGESNQRILNFSGLTMDAADSTAGARKTLTLDNVRFVCNRRGPATATGSSPTPITGTVYNGGGVTVGPMIPGGGAVAVQGRADLRIARTSFVFNIADFGSGGAVLAQAKDNGSPAVTVTDSNFDDGTITTGAQACQDSVYAVLTPASSTPVACSGTSLNVNSPCPALTSPGYAAYPSSAATRFGNYAGTGAAGSTGGAPPMAPPSPGTGTPIYGGALAVDATSTNDGNIGLVSITGSDFVNNKVGGSGGAISLINIQRTPATLPAVVMNDVGLNLNTAANNGGGVAVIGNTGGLQGVASLIKIDRTSFGLNIANGTTPAPILGTGKGGGLWYITRPGAPINFQMDAVRMSYNGSLSGGGGGLYAEDNGIDDSGTLNITRSTFDNNFVVAPSATGSGGGIHCGATKSDSQITNVTMSNNSAPRGGGLYVGSRCHLSLNNNSIIANSSTFSPTGGGTRGLGVNGGGGIFVDAGVVQNGRVDVRNSVIASNLSVPLTGGTETASENPGGPDCSAANNSILRSVSSNFVGTNSGCGPARTTGTPDPQQPFKAPAQSLASDNTVVDCVNPTTKDRVGDAVFAAATLARTPAPTTGVCAPPLNPRVRVLNDNGGIEIKGGRNFTHLPEEDSPLRNAGPTTCTDGTGTAISQDERGYFRGFSIAGNCDIGAVELDGGSSPTTPAFGVSSLSIPTTSQLQKLSPAAPTEVEMVRFRVTAPGSSSSTLKGIRVQAEAPVPPTGSTAGTGLYSSVVGLNIYKVTTDGVVLQTLYTSPEAPAGLQNNGFQDVTFSVPLSLAPGEVVNLSVKLLYGKSSQLAKAETGNNTVMMASIGGLGFAAILSAIVAGFGRIVSFLAVIMLVLGLGGCKTEGATDTTGGAGGGGAVGSKAFRMSVRQLVFDVGTATNIQQSMAATGPTIIVQP